MKTWQLRLNNKIFRLEHRGSPYGSYPHGSLKKSWWLIGEIIENYSECMELDAFVKDNYLVKEA